jgi:hypothetical protein
MPDKVDESSNLPEPELDNLIRRLTVIFAVAIKGNPQDDR